MNVVSVSSLFTATIIILVYITVLYETVSLRSCGCLIDFSLAGITT